MLIDTGLGIGNLFEVVKKLSDRPVIVIATHIHWDHIGAHKDFPVFYAHAEGLFWLQGEFPQSIETVRKLVMQNCKLPINFDIQACTLFQGTPSKVLYGMEKIELCGRVIQVIQTPGHSLGHMCFWEKERGYLFTGDLVYKGTLAAWYPSTDPEAYLTSLKKVAKLPIKKIFPAHFSLDIEPMIIKEMSDAFQILKNNGKLHHGSGVFAYEGWKIQL